MGEILKFVMGIFFGKQLSWIEAKQKSPEKMLFSKGKEFKNMTEKTIRKNSNALNYLFKKA